MTSEGKDLGFCVRVLEGRLMVGPGGSPVPCPHCGQIFGNWVLSAPAEGGTSAVCGLCRRRFTHPGITADLIKSISKPGTIWQSLKAAEADLLGGEVVS